MARKGGGFFLRPSMSSSAGMFARKGDPWVTRREGEEQYNRQVEVENPDMDADRQRHHRISMFSKEFQDRVKTVDVKMTMREAIDTEKSVRMDSYHAEKAFKRKPRSGEWPVAGRDFEVDVVSRKANSATVQRRMVNIAMRLKNDIRGLENPKSVGITSGGKTTSISARVDHTAKIACPRGCGYSSHDSRNISKHLQKFSNSSCTHVHCNCPDCKRARNEI